jgi:NAD(P)-dependent dehydrogenase (short-subunit alcohol dehydrogenase family)
MDLNGTSTIVTGGASGIGEACARLLARRGARPVIVDLQDDKGDAVARELGGVFVKADVADEDQVQAAVDAACELGPLRSLVNAAGIAGAARTLDRSGSPMPLADFELVLRVNLVGSFNCLRLAASAMSKTDAVDGDGQRGAIVNIASIAAFEGQTGQNAYAASKGGIVGMTLPIARDLVPAGIRVNTVAPGLIDTPIYSSIAADETQVHAVKEALAANTLFPRRLGRPAELASMVIECITNDYMNAEVVRVDGGTRLPPK